jgi:hypothetical protein
MDKGFTIDGTRLKFLKPFRAHKQPFLKNKLGVRFYYMRLGAIDKFAKMWHSIGQRISCKPGNKGNRCCPFGSSPIALQI